MQPALSAALGIRAGCRLFYKSLLRSKYSHTPSLLRSRVKWNRELDQNLNWEEISHNLLSCTKNTTLLWFQDRILHRILTTNTFVSKFMDVSPSCTFCSGHRETLLHLFAECEKVKCIWDGIKDMIFTRLGCQVSLNSQSIIVGPESDGLMLLENKNAIQRIIILGKYYIYRTKVAQGQILLSGLKAFADFYTKAEFNKAKEQYTEAEDIQRRTHLNLCLEALE